ncbi:dr1-associated corepressor isoform X2 [Polypterus senegalus]|uniref:dr1-associated corepressor isoform X2 n=2 Tax=Polypterus senegalus TaxID=55291 RepID=UPI001963C8F8|nr:dr1-associated corepressor isoform X2 [Polypterus senegalus]
MPGKKRKYNARFPPARIKKIMQKDKEVGKVASAVPVLISRALELFLKSLLTKSCQIAQSKHTRTMTQGHIQQCIETEKHFHFLKDMVNRFSSLRPSQEQACSKSGGRKSWQDVGAKHKEHGKIQRTGGQMKGSTGFPDSDDSEPELVICIENKISQRTFKKRSGQSEMTRSNYFSGSHLVGISPVLTAPQ